MTRSINTTERIYIETTNFNIMKPNANNVNEIKYEEFMQITAISNHLAKNMELSVLTMTRHL